MGGDESHTLIVQALLYRYTISISIALYFDFDFDHDEKPVREAHFPALASLYSSREVEFNKTQA